MKKNGMKEAIVEKLDGLTAGQQRAVLDFLESLDPGRQAGAEQNGDSPLSIFGKIEANFSEVPAEAWEQVPVDASENLDHYLYGTPKKGSRKR